MDPEVVAAIAARRKPSLRDAREQAVYDVSRPPCWATGRLPAALLRAARPQALGERGMVELVGILGYYSLVALTLNAFEIGLPDSLPRPNSKTRRSHA
jgi:4-carboxymuconolactone decarboxylase